MLTVKDNTSVNAITFTFIDSTRDLCDNKVTIPLSCFCDLELGTIDGKVYSPHEAPEREYRVKFFSQYGTGIDSYTVSENTFDTLYKVFMKHNLVDKHINIKRAFKFSTVYNDDIIVFKEDIESVSCVTYKSGAIYKIELSDDLFEISKEDYCYFKKMITNNKQKEVSRNVND